MQKKITIPPRPAQEIKIPFLGRQAQTNQQPKPHETADVPQPAMKIQNVLDRAVDVLERPDPVKSPPVATERISGQLSPGQIEAEKIRAWNRAELAKFIEENRQKEEKRKQEKAEAAKRAEEAAIQNANSWETRFRPYCGKDLSINIVTKQLLLKLMDVGKLHAVRAECVSRVAPLLEAWDVAFEARAKSSRSEFKRQLQEDIAENAELLRQGFSDLRPLQLGDEVERRYAIVRSQCKERQLELSKQINPVLLELAEKLQFAARKLCNERLAAEKAEAESFGIRFEPSPSLKYLITAGFDLRGVVERNYLASQLTSPRETLYRLLDPNTTWE